MHRDEMGTVLCSLAGVLLGDPLPRCERTVIQEQRPTVAFRSNFFEPPPGVP